MAGVWSIVVPQLSEYINLCTNPSFEANATNWTGVGAGSVVVAQVEGTKGFNKLTVTAATTNEGIYYGAVALTTSTTYTAGFDIKGSEASIDMKAYFADTSGNLVGSEHTFSISATYWQREYLSLACATTDNYRLYVIKTDTGGTIDFYLDAVSIIATTAELTYFDGDTDNCYWSGAAHASTSVCKATARNVGVVTDLQDYNLRVLTMDGVNTAPSTHHVTPYAMMPGAEYNGHKVQPRYITLTNATYGTSLENLHSKRKSIVNLFKHDLTAGDQPIILRYTGANASRPVDITCYLLQEIGQFDQQKVQRNAIQLACYDPYFYEDRGIGSSIIATDSATYSYFMARRNGNWETIAAATADDPGAGIVVRDILVTGAYTGIVLEEAPKTTNEKVFICGKFLNWGGGANNDYLAFYDFSTSTYSTLQAGTNGYVRSMDIAPDGTLYACGEFTQIGSATADRIAYWGGASWDVMGTGFGNTAYDVLVGNDGKVYAVGNDSTIGGVAGAAYVAYWDGANWQAMATGLDSVAHVLTKDNAGNIYIGGTQTGYVTKWDGTSLTSLACPQICWALKSTPSGKLYAGVNSATADYLYEYNGASWNALGAVSGGGGGGVYIYSIDIDADGLVWVGGDFTTAGDLTVQGLVCWNGYNFVHPDIQLPAATIVYTVRCNGDDIYIGYDTTGTSNYSELNTINNPGTARVYPMIRMAFSSAGGTSSSVRYIKNETTGAALYLDYTLQPGETIYIDTRERQRGITSSYYGNIWRAILRGSDLANFYLLPGNNTISAFIYTDGTFVNNIYIDVRHESIDGAAA